MPFSCAWSYSVWCALQGGGHYRSMMVNVFVSSSHVRTFTPPKDLQGVDITWCHWFFDPGRSVQQQHAAGCGHLLAPLLWRLVWCDRREIRWEASKAGAFEMCRNWKQKKKKKKNRRDLAQTAFAGHRWYRDFLTCHLLYLPKHGEEDFRYVCHRSVEKTENSSHYLVFDAENLPRLLEQCLSSWRLSNV